MMMGYGMDGSLTAGWLGIVLGTIFFYLVPITFGLGTAFLQMARERPGRPTDHSEGVRALYGGELEEWSE